MVFTDPESNTGCIVPSVAVADLWYNIKEFFRKVIFTGSHDRSIRAIAIGMIDKNLLGVGNSRGRRSQSILKINDVIDFWCIEDLQPDKRLLLRAKMKLPGKAWLEFNIEDEDYKRKLSVIPHYHTKTLLVKMHWYIFMPFHKYIFNNHIKTDIKKKLIYSFYKQLLKGKYHGRSNENKGATYR